MELAVGAMGPLFPKLLQLLEDKYVEQKGLKREVESLSREMAMVHATLVEVSQVPPERLTEPDKLWAWQIRELSYDMEDAVDAFMVRIAKREPATDTNVLKRIAYKATSTVKKIKDRLQISDKIKDIKDLSKELSELRVRYKFSGAAHANNTGGGVDPRVINLHKNEGRELVGIDKARDELLRMLTNPPESPNKSLKIISVVGSGGLGKTTLAKLVHDQLKEQSFDCSAFVSAGRTPDLRNTLREMLEKLGQMCSSDMTNWKAERICDELREFLHGKRYNIVVDDVWENETWEAIKCSLPDSNYGSKVIITTRNFEVGTKANDVYKLKPLSPDKSKELFCKRTSSKNNEGNQLVDKIVDKCDGVPLAIIAIASLLADRPLEDWQTVYDSLIVGRGDKTRTILLYSYYDMPPYLKPCLLYLSMYSEDSLIEKSTLIWRWIAEGFVQLQNEGRSSLLEVGEGYFDKLLNRSMIQPVEMRRPGIIDGCCVHDIVLDLIRDLSTEENFVTILGEKHFVQSSTSAMTRRMKEVGLHGSERKVRRLSIQRPSGQYIPEDTIGMPEVVRSLVTIDCSIEVPPLSSFLACRVLSVKGIQSNIGDLRHLGKLIHLRYLELSGCYDELPNEIGNLKSLQTLIIYSGIWELPPSVCELTKLMCLHAPYIDETPTDRMGNLVCLEELKLSVRAKVLDDFVVKLCKLTRLRVLDIDFWCDVNESSYKALVQSLNNLQEIRELTLRGFISTAVTTWKSWEPPRQLWSLDVNIGLSPQLMDPSRFQRLRYLHLSVRVVEEAGGMLGNLVLLPQLLCLKLWIYTNQHQGLIIVGAEGLENLRVCVVGTKLKFLEGAMPMLESLRFQIRPGRDLEEMNLATLVSLKEVEVTVDCRRSFRGDVEEAEAVVRREVEEHPNCPTLHISRDGESESMLDDEVAEPDKVVRVLLNARDWKFIDYVFETPIGVDMRLYRWLEEITYDIDCEGSRLSKVEEVEARLRFQAALHPKRPKLLMNRINQDKMMSDDDASLDS